MKRLVYSSNLLRIDSQYVPRKSRKNVTTVCNFLNIPQPSVSRASTGHRCSWDGLPFLYRYRVDEVCKKLCNYYGLDYDSTIKHIQSPYDKIPALARIVHKGEKLAYGDPEFDTFHNMWQTLMNDSKIEAKAKEQAEEDLNEVYKGTGIDCVIDRKGFLIVPFVEN